MIVGLNAVVRSVKDVKCAEIVNFHMFWLAKPVRFQILFKKDSILKKTRVCSRQRQFVLITRMITRSSISTNQLNLGTSRYTSVGPVAYSRLCRMKLQADSEIKGRDPGFFVGRDGFFWKACRFLNISDKTNRTNHSKTCFSSFYSL